MTEPPKREVTTSGLQFAASSSSPDPKRFCPPTLSLGRVNLVATLNMVLTPLTSISLSTSAYNPAQKRISAPTWQRVWIGLFMNFPSKQALFRAFQMAQQIPDIPHRWNFFPFGNHRSHQVQHWDKDVGILLAPSSCAMTPQITLDTRQLKRRWSTVSAWS